MAWFGKPQQMYYYKPITKVGLAGLIDRFPKDLSTSDTILSDFGAANKQRVSDLRRLAGTTETDLTGLLAKANAFDPMATREAVLTGDLAKISALAGSIAGYGAGQLKDLGARWSASQGYDARPGSYEKALTFDRVSKNFTPLISGVFAGATPTTQTFNSILGQNTDLATRLLNARLQTPNIGVNEILDPLNALYASRGAQVGQLGDMAGVARANSAGFTTTPGISDYINSGLDMAGKVVNIAGNAYTGGALGAAGAPGLGGILGGGTTSTGTSLPSNFGTLPPAYQAWYLSQDQRYNNPSSPYYQGGGVAWQ